MRAAVDIGGTFTDVLIHNESKGEFYAVKVHSNLIDPAVAFIEGIGQALALSGSVSDNLREFLHGTTIVTNALLEGKTAKVGLLVTEGFRDLWVLRSAAVPAHLSSHPSCFDLRPRLKLPVKNCHATGYTFESGPPGQLPRRPPAFLAPQQPQPFVLVFLCRPNGGNDDDADPSLSRQLLPRVPIYLVAHP